jgi:hypothetical protein
VNKWQTRIVLVNAGTDEKREYAEKDEDTGLEFDIVLALCQLRARFDLDGKAYFAAPPTADPVRKLITYYAKTYDK